MRRISIGMMILMLMIFLCPISYSRIAGERTIKGFQSSQLIKRGDIRIYKVTFSATGNTASFTIYNSLTSEEGSNDNVMTEGSEATSGNGKCYNFYDDPLEMSTGAYIVINSMNVIVEYD